MQMNIDIVVAMQCHDLHVNVQDAAGDRILAGDALKKDPTNWLQWRKRHDAHKLGKTYDEDVYGTADEDVHDYLGAARRGKKKFDKTPRLRGEADACRIYGSMEENKVQGDFHITARGHGYLEFGLHLDHSCS
jgi:endoplasmic reticulum-Golgi intermediate compartment protein 2